MELIHRLAGIVAQRIAQRQNPQQRLIAHHQHHGLSGALQLLNTFIVLRIVIFPGGANQHLTTFDLCLNAGAGQRALAAGQRNHQLTLLRLTYDGLG